MSADRKGRQTDDQMHQNFDALCWWLEDNFDDLCSLDELHMKMITIAGSVDTLYLRKHLKRKLIEHYGDNIFFLRCEWETQCGVFLECSKCYFN